MKTRIDQRIDEIGRLQAKVSVLDQELKRQKEKLIEQMKIEGLDRANGFLFNAIIVVKDYGRTDWRKVAEKLRPPHQLVTAHTKRVHSEYVQIGTRKVEVA